MPLVSVVMPVYNAVDTVGAAVRSLLAQTHPHLEIIVVDDGSTDGSGEFVRQMRDPRIRLIQTEHSGLVGALQVGCTAAGGAYIARLDADDLADPTRVQRQVEFMERHPEVGLVGTWALFEEEGGGQWAFEPPTDDEPLRRYLVYDNPFVHSSLMFRAAALRDAGGYVGGAHEDYRLCIRVAERWRVAVIPERLVTYRIRRDSLSRRIRRTRNLGARLSLQWEAARRFRLWRPALLPLLKTAGLLVAESLGGGLAGRLRPHAARRARGLRDLGAKDMS